MMASGSPVLSMEGVRLSFGAKRVLDGLAFSVARGECFGFLGPSGAGKTTTIKLLTRQLVKDAGRINLFGRPIETPPTPTTSASASSRTRARSTSA